MEHFIQAGELIMLVLLTITQLGRWSQKTEDAPQDAARTAREALKKAEDTQYELRKHKHAYQDFLNGRFKELDQIYARKREVELELRNIADKQDTDCDRITAVEERITQFIKI